VRRKGKRRHSSRRTIRESRGVSTGSKKKQQTKKWSGAGWGRLPGRSRTHQAWKTILLVYGDGKRTRLLHPSRNYYPS
jgi:hypothetical protein